MCMKYLNYYLTIALIMLMSVGAKSQVTNSESFDGTTFVPTGWTNLYISGTSSASWVRSTGGSHPSQSTHSGAGQAAFLSWTYSSSERAIITPSYDLSNRGSNTPTVSFWMYRDGGFSSSNDVIQAYMNTSASMSGAVLVGTVYRHTSKSPSVGSTGWYQYTFNVPASFNGSTNYFILKATSDYGNDIYVDDVSWVSYPPACTGTPNPGNTLASSNPLCLSSSTTLSLQNATTGVGVSYQWQSSTNGSTYTNVSSGGTSNTYTASPTASTYYRCIVSCSNSGFSGTSTPIQITINNFLNCYCIPQIGGGSSSQGCLDDDMITNVSFGTLNNSSTCSGTNTTISYIDYGGSVAAPTLTIGSSYTLGVTCENEWGDHLAAWIDFNQNGTFESSEFVSLGTTSGSGTPQTLSTSWTIPTTATAGTTKMRVKNRYNTTQTGTTACTGYTYGECEDYNITLTCPTLSITTQPTNQTECSGDNATFTVAASTTGGFTVSRQWQVNTGSGWTNAASTATTLTINSVNSTMNGNMYRCIISSNCGNSDTTNTATLTVNEAPAITNQPTNTTTCDGSNASFTVAATGTNLSYQWEVNSGSGWSNVTNGGVYSNATTATLNITGATVAMSGNMYRCTISGTCPPAVTTNSVQLTVNTLPAVTSSPSNKTICPATNTSFTCSGTGTSIAYQWQVNNGSGWANISNGGVYSNVTTNTLNITGATLGMTGYKYRCNISGACTPTVSTSDALLTVTNENLISTHPANTLVCTGTPGNMFIAATGFNLTYQWQINTGSGWTNATNGSQYSGVTSNTIVFLNPTLTQNGYMFRCITTNACGTTNTSNSGSLSVITAPTITSQPTSKTICKGSNTSFSVMATSSGSIEYRWQYNTGSGWITLDNTSVYSGVKTNTLVLTNPNQYYNGIQYRCLINTGCTPSATSNVVSLTVNEAPVITQNPTSQFVCPGSSTSMMVAATGAGASYQWQVNTGSGWSNLSNGGNYSGATTTTLGISGVTSGMSGYQYRCVVSGTCSPSATSTAATITTGVNTNLLSNPSSITTCSPGTGTFSVSATGSNVVYKWYTRAVNTTTWTQVSNSSIYSGANTGSLTVSNITASNQAYAYEYYCEVSGSCGSSQNSSIATFTVNAKPSISTHPQSVDLCNNNQTTFSIIASGTNISYQWQVNTGSSWSNLSNNATYSNVTTSTLAVNSLTTSMNGYKYRCVVSGTCSPNAVSNEATLLVNPVVTPAVSIVSTNTDICDGETITFNASGINGGTQNLYQWHVNGNIVASGSTFSSTTLADNDEVYCSFTSNQKCRTKNIATSNKIFPKVTQNKVPTISITSSSGNVECSGVPVTFKANISNGGANPDYNWQINNQPVGSNIDSHVTSTLNNGDVVRCVLTSSYRCPTPKIVTSSSITMTINKTTKSSIVILPAADTVVCKNTPVTLLSYFTNGGSTPQYQWMLNGTDIQGETKATLVTSTLNDQDVVQCRFISSALCVFPEVSAGVQFTVNNPLDPKVDIAVSYNGGESYTFTALPTNGGNNPGYQWYANGRALAGETDPTFTTSAYGPNSQIYVEMTSSLSCVSSAMVSSRRVTTSVKTVVGAFDEIGLYPNPNNGQFNIKGQLSNAVTNETVTLKITNALGQTVYNQVYPASGRTLDMPVSLGDNLANGLYTVNIIVDDQVTNLRFMLNR